MKPKKGFLKRIFGNPLTRGILKSFPIGNWAYEIAENIKFSRDPKNSGAPLPHSPLSLLAQAVFLGLIIYAFVTHQVTIDDLLRYIGPDDFKSFGDFVLPSDTLR